jgi:hypothetical protein
MDSYTVRLRVIFVLLFLLFAILCFGQNYRVRAVRENFYITDTAYAGYPFQVLVKRDQAGEPVIKDMLFRLTNSDYNFCVLTSPDQVCTLLVIPGQYFWELWYRESESEPFKLATGRIFVK